MTVSTSVNQSTAAGKASRIDFERRCRVISMNRPIEEIRFEESETVRRIEDLVGFAKGFSKTFRRLGRLPAQRRHNNRRDPFPDAAEVARSPPKTASVVSSGLSRQRTPQHQVHSTEPVCRFQETAGSAGACRLFRGNTNPAGLLRRRLRERSQALPSARRCRCQRRPAVPAVSH